MSEADGTVHGGLEDDHDPMFGVDRDDVRRARAPHVVRPAGSHYRGGDKPQPERWRCLTTGCNPVLDEATASAHLEETGHRVAKWPVRSKAGKRRARERNKSGYYDKYNVGLKSAEWRLS